MKISENINLWHVIVPYHLWVTWMLASWQSVDWLLPKLSPDGHRSVIDTGHHRSLQCCKPKQCYINCQSTLLPRTQWLWRIPTWPDHQAWYPTSPPQRGSAAGRVWRPLVGHLVQTKHTVFPLSPPTCTLYMSFLPWCGLICHIALV